MPFLLVKINILIKINIPLEGRKNEVAPETNQGYYIMRKASSLLLFFASIAMAITSCGKDDSIGNGGNDGLPTFATLYSYIGRSDIEAIKEEFAVNGYDVWMENDDYEPFLIAENDLGYYTIDALSGIVVGIRYSYIEDNTGKTKSLLLSKLDEEKQFRRQSGLTDYSGFYFPLNGDGHEVRFSSKDDLISALQSLDLATVAEGGSISTYSNLETAVYFGVDDDFGYGITVD